MASLAFVLIVIWSSPGWRALWSRTRTDGAPETWRGTEPYSSTRVPFDETLMPYLTQTRSIMRLGKWNPIRCTCWDKS